MSIEYIKLLPFIIALLCALAIFIYDVIILYQRSHDDHVCCIKSAYPPAEITVIIGIMYAIAIILQMCNTVSVLRRAANSLEKAKYIVMLLVCLVLFIDALLMFFFRYTYISGKGIYTYIYFFSFSKTECVLKSNELEIKPNGKTKKAYLIQLTDEEYTIVKDMLERYYKP